MSTQRSRFSKVFLSLAFASIAAVGVAHQASAVTISSHGTICNPYGTMVSTDLLYTESGVWNNIATQTRSVICSVPRIPVAGGGQTFVIEGTNAPGKTTTCAALVFSSTGTFISSKSFSSTGLPYTRSLVFNATELPNFAYVNVICTLPANRGGYVRGIRAL